VPSSNNIFAVSLPFSETTLATAVFNKQTELPELHNTDVSELAIAIVAEIGTVAVCFTWLGIDSLGCVLWSLGGNYFSLVPLVLQILVWCLLLHFLQRACDVLSN